jgi:archaellum component FlaG (FlaF/FlaG flagellin family)
MSVPLESQEVRFRPGEVGSTVMVREELSGVSVVVLGEGGLVVVLERRLAWR